MMWRTFSVWDWHIRDARSLRRSQFLQGGVLILFGVTIAVFPQLLVALIASFFMMLGLIICASAWSLRAGHGSHHRAGRDWMDIN
jgi:hypothetical protein